MVYILHDVHGEMVGCRFYRGDGICCVMSGGEIVGSRLYYGGRWYMLHAFQGEIVGCMFSGGEWGGGETDGMLHDFQRKIVGCRLYGGGYAARFPTGDRRLQVTWRDGEGGGGMLHDFQQEIVGLLFSGEPRSLARSDNVCRSSPWTPELFAC